MNDFSDMTPKQHVFLSLQKLSAFVSDAQDLNATKFQILRALANIASWEPLLFDSSELATSGKSVTPNVEANRHFAAGRVWLKMK